MKKVGIYVVLCITAIMLVGCGHTHNWQEATCVSPKTCSDCGEAEGQPLGHTWTDATCTQPKTCSVCQITEGEAFGHVWQDATCEKPKECKVCGETEGQPLGHTWTDATCTNAKVCSVCNKTEGQPLGHEAQVTCTEGAECGRCGEYVEAFGHDWTDANCTEAKTCKVCGESEGEALGHTTSNGVCDRCGLEIIEPITGKGDDVVTGITLPDSGIYRAHITNSGRSNFVVRMYDSSGGRDLLVNEIGSYDGRVYLNASGNIEFEVNSSGNWSIELEKLPQTTETSFSGKGDYVTDIFTSSATVWQIKHDGRSNFVVKIYTTSGRDLLVNEIGSYEGKVRAQIPSGSNAFFEINADGNWSVEPAN